MGSSSKGSSPAPDNSGQTAAYQQQLAQQKAQADQQATQQAQQLAQQQAQHEAQVKAQQEEAAKLAAEREAQRVSVGMAGRDKAYGSYLDAASGATDYVNTMIRQEQSNAALLGIEYNVTDEQKASRINDQFASVWGESDQNNLDAQLAEWGKPQGYDENFAIKRGTAPVGSKAGSESTVASTNPNWNPDTVSSTLPTLLGEEEEENKLGGSSTILGG